MENEGKMTKEEEKQVAKNEALYKWLIGILIGVIFIALTSFVASVQSKADIDYVDKKDLILDQKITDHKTETEKKLDKIDSKLDKLIDLHIENK